MSSLKPVDDFQIVALSDYFQTVFGQEDPSGRNKVALAFLEAYKEKGGKMSISHLAALAANTCPEKGKYHGILSKWRGAVTPPGQEPLPFQKLVPIVEAITGWQAQPGWKPTEPTLS